ncbi:2Fe-2S iron-sulfur cluster-binding protein [Gemmatimonas sp.]|jgi:NADH-quinone oxidoreductase subunit G|uniref:2Fe-2S iron-sulfur cluster-binding protein n=1 Tax=Gemmatimonas sp. TaxID=1962908 RepID=UPI0037BE3719
MADVKMVSLTIEGRPVTVPDGMSILEAAKTAGVLVPHYCYHPGLPVAGVCRMCLVEVEKMPKLAPACATTVMEGQVVHVHSPKALDARQGVLEFLLINHPLDCPICDQAGECELQDYTFAEGRADSRYREPKRFNPVEDFGGDVLYVQNRCILCTRCVRFMGDVAQEPVLNVSERGDRAFIGKAEGHDLTNPWAGNVIDLCPVGALLSKDFLNKARAWELDRAPTICTGCSQGCNAVAETRDNVPVRLKPRPNDAVNQYYMCEVGRQTYRDFARRDRADQPMVRQNGTLAIADWEDAIAAAVRALGGVRVMVLASPNLSNEALFLLERLIAQVNGRGTFRVEHGDEVPLPGAPDLALRSERAANATGARMFGFTEVASVADATRQGDALLVVGDALDNVSAADLAGLSSLVYIGTTLPPAATQMATAVLPITTTLEEEGTFTNLRGRVQRFLQARTAPGVARPTWYVLADLLAAAGGNGQYFLPSEVFAALAAAQPTFAGLEYEALGLRGLPVLEQGAETVAGVSA